MSNNILPQSEPYRAISVNIYKPPYGDCSNYGISANHDKATLVLSGEPPESGGPYVVIEPGYSKTAPPHAVEYGETNRPMFGGCFIYSSDSRFPADSPIKLMDRTEPKRVPVKSITITRVEGPCDLCNKPTQVDNWPDANMVLSKWSNTVTEGGGYDKCKFCVTFDDGSTYEGRYDLYHPSHGTDENTQSPDLYKHVRDFLTFLAGNNKPAHMSDDGYQEYIGDKAARNEAAEWIRKYL